MWSVAAMIVLLSGAAVALSGSPVEAADNAKVSMKDELAFPPSEVTVPVGGAVVWHNDGSLQHDAKADNGSFSIPMVDPGKDSKAVSFSTPGDITYFCTVPGHKSAGMVGTIHVVSASTPPPAASTPTTQAGSATTPSIRTAAGEAPAGQSTTTTPLAKAAGGGSTTTSTAAANGSATTTTVPQAQSVTPTSAPEGQPASATGPGGEQTALEGHASEGGSRDEEKCSPIGIAFAAVATLLLGGIAGKLLASKP
jgi:plastocyanin